MAETQKKAIVEAAEELWDLVQWSLYSSNSFTDHCDLSDRLLDKAGDILEYARRLSPILTNAEIAMSAEINIDRESSLLVFGNKVLDFITQLREMPSLPKRSKNEIYDGIRDIGTILKDDFPEMEVKPEILRAGQLRPRKKIGIYEAIDEEISWVTRVMEEVKNLLGYPNAKYFPERTDDLIWEAYQPFKDATYQWVARNEKSYSSSEIHPKMGKLIDDSILLEEDYEKRPHNYDNLGDLWVQRAYFTDQMANIIIQSGIDPTGAELIAMTCENFFTELRRFGVGIDPSTHKVALTRW